MEILPHAFLVLTSFDFQNSEVILERLKERPLPLLPFPHKRIGTIQATSEVLIPGIRGHSVFNRRYSAGTIEILITFQQTPSLTFLAKVQNQFPTSKQDKQFQVLRTKVLLPFDSVTQEQG
jgi:hypothetical protein